MTQPHPFWIDVKLGEERLTVTVEARDRPAAEAALVALLREHAAELMRIADYFDHSNVRHYPLVEGTTLLRRFPNVDPKETV